jgi:hypothetical protein
MEKGTVNPWDLEQLESLAVPRLATAPSGKIIHIFRAKGLLRVIAPDAEPTLTPRLVSTCGRVFSDTNPLVCSSPALLKGLIAHTELMLCETCGTGAEFGEVVLAQQAANQSGEESKTRAHTLESFIRLHGLPVLIQTVDFAIVSGPEPGQPLEVRPVSMVRVAEVLKAMGGSHG